MLTQNIEEEKIVNIVDLVKKGRFDKKLLLAEEQNLNLLGQGYVVYTLLPLECTPICYGQS